MTDVDGGSPQDSCFAMFCGRNVERASATEGRIHVYRRLMRSASGDRRLMRSASGDVLGSGTMLHGKGTGDAGGGGVRGG